MALLLLLASMVLVMAAGSGTWAETITMTMQSLALIASIRAALPGGPLRALIVGVITFGILVVWVQAAFVDRVDPAVVPAATFLLVLIATPIIIWGLIKEVRDVGAISIRTMMGVICIYLLLSLAFASSFAVVDASIDDPFFEQGAEWSSLRNYLYYSLTTITTVGIGDLTPSGDLGRSLTASEALIGQIYIVTVVALIVGNIGLKRRS